MPNSSGGRTKQATAINLTAMMNRAVTAHQNAQLDQAETLYRSVLAEVLKQLVPVHFIAVEKKEPFRCGVWHVSEDTLDQCARENAAAIGRLKECRRLGAWPTGYEEVRVFDAI